MSATSHGVCSFRLTATSFQDRVCIGRNSNRLARYTCPAGDEQSAPSAPWGCSPWSLRLRRHNASHRRAPGTTCCRRGIQRRTRRSPRNPRGLSAARVPDAAVVRAPTVGTYPSRAPRHLTWEVPSGTTDRRGRRRSARLSFHRRDGSLDGEIRASMDCPLACGPKARLRAPGSLGLTLLAGDDKMDPSRRGLLIDQRTAEFSDFALQLGPAFEV